MRNLTKTELKRKSELHPDLQKVAEAARAKHDFYYTCGYRDKEAQDHAVKLGNSKVNYPDSKHNRSRDPNYKSDAVDVWPFQIIKGQIVILWNNPTSTLNIYKAMLEASVELNIKIRCGADFNGDGILTNDPFIDGPHFELK